MRNPYSIGAAPQIYKIYVVIEEIVYFKEDIEYLIGISV